MSTTTVSPQPFVDPTIGVIEGKEPSDGPSLEELVEQQDLISAHTLAPARGRAIAERQWLTYLFTLHSDRERPMAFQRVMHLMTDQEYWQHLGDVWTGHDGAIILHPEPMVTWLKLFKSKRPWRAKMMDAEERRVLRALPSKVKVFRGCQAGRERELSWTLSEVVARDFAERRRKRIGSEVECGVLTATVNKDRILAYFDERREQEVVLDPTSIRIRLHETI